MTRKVGAIEPGEAKAVREELGLNQSQMAERLMLGKYGYQTVAKWETGQVEMSGPVRIAYWALRREAPKAAVKSRRSKVPATPS